MMWRCDMVGTSHRRALSSVGRAPPLQGGGRGIETPSAHKQKDQRHPRESGPRRLASRPSRSPFDVRLSGPLSAGGGQLLVALVEVPDAVEGPFAHEEGGVLAVGLALHVLLDSAPSSATAPVARPSASRTGPALADGGSIALRGRTAPVAGRPSRSRSPRLGRGGAAPSADDPP